LVQPVLDENCVRCHSPDADDPAGRKFDLTASKAYESLVGYGQPSLRDHVAGRYKQGFSTEGECAASVSLLLSLLTDPHGHSDVSLDADSVERLIVWLDTYGQRLGSFDEKQEQELLELRKRSAGLLIERGPKQAARDRAAFSDDKTTAQAKPNVGF
jgi:hypothetical protein